MNIRGWIVGVRSLPEREGRKPIWALNIEGLNLLYRPSDGKLPEDMVGREVEIFAQTKWANKRPVYWAKVIRFVG